jgi:hypothetical protein
MRVKGLAWLAWSAAFFSQILAWAGSFGVPTPKVQLTLSINIAWTWPRWAASLPLLDGLDRALFDGRQRFLYSLYVFYRRC